MSTLMSLLHLSLSALQADQAALNATSNNIANQNTPGYTKEIVQWQSQDTVTLSGAAADGVSVSGPVSQRDRVLEQRVQQQMQLQSQSAAIESALQQVQNIFSLGATGSSASTTALGTAVNNFWTSLSSLASNPSDAATRQGVLNAANALASQFNSAATQLSQITSGLNQEAVSDVGQINTLTSTIADLNSKIANLSPNADAGVLEDQRQVAIAQLSTYIGTDQITTDSNGITLTTGNGQVLVSGNTNYPLQTTQVNGTTHILAGANAQDITSQITGGQLGGIISVRDNTIPTIAASLDTLANSIATSVNQQNSQGVDGYGNPGQNLFTISASVAGSASSITVSTTDPQLIAAASTGEGSAGNDNAQALAALSGSDIAGGATASDYYAALLAQIGSTVSNASADNSSQQTALTQLTGMRDSVSAVSLDEEAENLTQYQRSYEAASRLFTIVDSVMATALNLGEDAAVS
ncbi:flagellar hook-associated protein FlgK [Granulicella sp. dw_53]|uniref:flagellar hook-associated protein FlgK n=1 Tax=Granulicella sp. dw_53 TaxID=2719792 RepID=UPI001BD54DA8|nr:flagellar hook-associated protein FlgK [Granulicella sp. dw_53]